MFASAVIYHNEASTKWLAFPAFPVHAQPAILRFWQEAHGLAITYSIFLKVYDSSVEASSRYFENFWDPFTKRSNLNPNISE